MALTGQHIYRTSRLEWAVVAQSVCRLATVLDSPGIESRWGARFSASVQTRPGAHAANCTWGKVKGKDKAVPLQAWSDPKGSRKVRLPDFVTTEQDGGKFVSLTHRPPLHPGNAPGTHLC